VSEFPQKIKQDLCVFLYADIYKQINFLKHKKISFTSWVCPLLKAWIVHENEYVYSEGDDIKVMYFNPNNCVSYVLPTFLNREYVCVSKGNDFGLTDLVYAIYNSSKTKKDLFTCAREEICLDNWYEDNNINFLKR